MRHRSWTHFCNVREDCVIENRTLENLYGAPLMLESSGFSGIVCRELNINAAEPDLKSWREMTEGMLRLKDEVRIGLVGKYVHLHDAYLSVVEALKAGGYANGAMVNIIWINSEEIDQGNVADILSGLDGIIVPGGFGDRGIQGMILSAQYARENDIPYFGICLGMQIAVIEFARNAAGIADACSGEFQNATQHKVIDFMPGQSDDVDKGGTLRLGSYPCRIIPGTLMEKCYQSQDIKERHRHRYEFNNEYRDILTDSGLIISGISPDGTLVETVEISDHPFYLGVQFHPEFKSRPNRPHPLFREFVRAALENQRK